MSNHAPADPDLRPRKVAELKELAAKHGLPQSGLKNDLVERLTAAGVSPGGQAEGEELVDVPDAAPAASAPAPAPAAPAPAPAPAAQPTPAAAPAAEAPKAPEPTPSAPAPAAAPPAPAAAPAAESKPAEAAAPAEVRRCRYADADVKSTSDEIPDDELTEEQKKQKARAARFGIPFKVTKPKPAPMPAAAPAAKPEQPREKPAAIDKAPLGESAEVLARRAAKFGPVKKAEPAPAAAPAAPAPVEKKEELTP